VVSLALALVGMTVPAAASYAVTPSDLYVATAADGGDDTHDCSQVDPCATVQHAVDLAAAAGTTIHIGAGSFSGEIQPGAKSVAFEGVSTDETTLTTPEDSVDGFVLGVTTGTTTLTKVTVQGGLLMDVWVSGDATFTADDVVLAQAGCGLVVVGVRRSSPTPPSRTADSPGASTSRRRPGTSSSPGARCQSSGPRC
jgi:hypothetical protein